MLKYYFVLLLFILWTFFWSFASVIIYRLHSKEKGIFFGRSHCPKCNHILGALELIPIFSYLKNLWKCKYCKTKISIKYPILEISFWILFALVWYFLIDFNLILNWNFLEIFKLIFWLYISFFSMILFFYDIFYFEISERIMLLLIAPIFLVLFWQTFFSDFFVINTLTNATSYNFLVLFLSSLLAFFWIIWLYVIMLKELDEKWDFLILAIIIFWLFFIKYFFNIEFSLIPILSWFIWALAIFIFFFLQIVISKWKWMWGWDLRIAIFIWLLLWISYSFFWVLISYIVWSIIWIFIIIYKKLQEKKKKLFKIKKDNNDLINTEVPFWPFLVIWLFSILFFQEEIIYLVNKYFYL